MTNVMNKVGKAVDTVLAERAAGTEPQPKSVVLTTFTEAAFFQRCSADRDRLYYSVLLSLDESYRFLKMLGLTTGSSSGKEHAATPTDGASQWNALMQTGHSSMSCKTGVSYESRNATCSVVGVGNLHAAPFISLAKLGRALFVHIYIYTYIHIYICTYVHIYICTYVHIYIYTYPGSRKTSQRHALIERTLFCHTPIKPQNTGYLVYSEISHGLARSFAGILKAFCTAETAHIIEP